MASPTVLIKDGADAYVPSDNGVNVTPGNTVTIKLASSGDLDSWFVACVTTDDLSSAVDVNAALVFDNTLLTATLVAPPKGRALRFQSVVNGGRDRNGVRQASYSTTFVLYTINDNGLRCHALDETTEGSDVAGWGKDVNEALRVSGSLDSPHITGNPLFIAEHTVIVGPLIREIRTESTDPAELLSIEVPEGGATAYDGVILYTGDAGDTAGRWKFSVLYHRNGNGPAELTGALEAPAGQSDTADTIAIGLGSGPSANYLVVTVTPADAFIRNWSVRLVAQSTATPS
jgi:hypothetical protein